jgi:hypothetical protein
MNAVVDVSQEKGLLYGQNHCTCTVSAPETPQLSLFVVVIRCVSAVTRFSDRMGCSVSTHLLLYVRRLNEDRVSSFIQTMKHPKGELALIQLVHLNYFCSCYLRSQLSVPFVSLARMSLLP